MKTPPNRHMRLVARIVPLLLLMLCSWTLVGCSFDRTMREVNDTIFEPTPSEYVAMLFNKTDPDKRRRALGALSSAPFGGEAPYVKAYALFVDDPDATVRAAAIQALGKWAGPEVTPMIVRRLRDDAPYVRWEAAKALQQIYTPEALSTLVDVATKDDDADVRMACADALGQFPDKRSFETLVGLLVDTDHGVAQTAEKSLTTLTGNDLGPDGAVWLLFEKQNPPPKLFADQRQYYWEPFNRPLGFWQALKFWDLPPGPQPPQLPRGMKPISSPATQTGK